MNSKRRLIIILLKIGKIDEGGVTGAKAKLNSELWII